MTTSILRAAMLGSCLALAIPAVSSAQTGTGNAPGGLGGAGSATGSGSVNPSTGGAAGAGAGGGLNAPAAPGATDPAATGTVQSGDSRCAGVLANRARYTADVIASCEKK